MICVMMKLDTHAENHGKKNIIIFVLIHLKKDIKEDTVFVTRAKTHKLNAFQKRNIFD